MTSPKDNDSPPYAGVICLDLDTGVGIRPGCGKVDIDYIEYMCQMSNPNARWKCPKCGSLAEFDDERYEEINLPEGDE